MAEPVYQHQTPPVAFVRVAALMFEGNGPDARVDALVKVEKGWMIIGHYLEGRHRGKRVLLGKAWSASRIVQKWNRRYGETLTVLDLLSARHLKVPTW